MKTRSSMMRVCLFVVAAGLTMVSQAYATTIFFTTEAALNTYMAGTTPATTVTMVTDWGNTEAYPQARGTDVAVGGVRLVNAEQIFGANNGAGQSGWPAQIMVGVDSSVTQLFPDSPGSNATALGAVLYGVTAKNAAGTVYLKNGLLTDNATFSVDYSTSAPVFLGVASTDVSWKIDHVDFNVVSTTNCQPIFSTVTFGTQNVPEPSTIILLGMGLLGLLAYAWRKRK
jgi:hypothetical protein